MPGILPGAGQPRTEVFLLPVYWLQLFLLPGYQGEVNLPGFQKGENPSSGCEEEAEPLTSKEEFEEEGRISERKVWKFEDRSVRTKEEHTQV